MPKAKSIFEKVVCILPREQLESIVRDFGVERPWHMTRQELEICIIARESYDLRKEILDWLTEQMRV